MAPGEVGFDEGFFVALHHEGGVVSHVIGNWARQGDVGSRFRVDGAAATLVVPDDDGQTERLMAGRTPGSEGSAWGTVPESRWGAVHRGGTAERVPSELGDWSAFYTGFGHTKESYADPVFRGHLAGGIRYAIGDAQADCRPENGYRPLFDGTATSLDGWRQAGPGAFTLSDDGTLTSTGGMGMLWYAGSGLSSYSLKLDWRLAGDDNSGVFVGFPPSEDPWSAVDHGYEIQIDATDVPEKTTGSVYGFRSADLKKRDRALNPPGEWNTYEIRVEGERLRVWLNGVKINDFTNTDPARSLREGRVGIQNHGADDQVSFRDIRIKELPAKGD